ncbi:DUF6287 domain-containing protein [Eupransor demetentiae]|uniref:DUF6287 domain-containing protein n=1 Tax=Eupransor demetentiae TaxID=3109584 RepID=A0ABM9N5Q0_9LACO|nr:hypothetical protein R54876_GBNLAHCA_01106 [Lactobacillaceae bacterium LMG 33000]
MKKSYIIGGLIAFIVLILGAFYLIGSNHNESKSQNQIVFKHKGKQATKKTSGMKLEEIKNGNFESVAGTWQKSDGSQIVFDSKGLVSSTNNGNVNTDQKIYLDSGKIDVDGTSIYVNSHIENGVLKAKLGAKELDPNGASILTPTDFIPKGVSADGSGDNDHDRIYIGQQYGSENIFTKVDGAKQESSSGESKTIGSLSDRDKEALALLGLPEDFDSDYGKIKPAYIFAGQMPVGSNAMDDNGQWIKTVSFDGVRFKNEDGRMNVLLNNPDNHDNITYVQGSFSINGDTVTYENHGTRVGGSSQPAGQKSLSDLYKQFHKDPKFNQMKNAIH